MASERTARVTTSADILAVVNRRSAAENVEITETVPRAEPWRASAYLSRKSTGIAAPATAPIASEKLSAISTVFVSWLTEYRARLYRLSLYMIS